jgi:hypothetical protein
MNSVPALPVLICEAATLLQSANGSSACASRFDDPAPTLMVLCVQRARVALAALENPSPCEACGEAFTCGASLTGCWCMKVRVSGEARARLRERYTKCICRACLERESEGDVR